MKKRNVWLLCIFLLCILGSIGLSSCDSSGGGENASVNHIHNFSMWTTSVLPSCTTQGTQTRTCSSCGFSEYSQIPASGHTETTDVAIPATCTESGKSVGSHCVVCNVVIVPQTQTAATGHTPVTDMAIAPSCTTDGKTEGSHCGTCKTILVEQSVISATGHLFDDGEVVTKATCIKEGIKIYTCTVLSCKYTYKDTYFLPTFSSTELFNQSVKYVGEIVTYDKNGNEYSLGTGFVISSDGRIVTNYHVIEGAYSATISIDGKTYNIASVLAYDATIDLAVLKVNAGGLTAATICKNPVSVGETVYAIGSSRGMTNTYSQGIITYADRIVDGVSHIQHDASITHGNSGGPLINAYGEVVGINTWEISDSQNLNFAVFVDELDNLTYGSPLTLEEMYLRECDVFEKLKNYIIYNGEYYYDGDYYVLTLETSYSSDYTSKYTREAYYYTDDNEITLDFLIDDGDCWAYFVIDDSVDGAYFWSYFDSNDNDMDGTLYAASYDDETLLGYSYSNISDSSIKNGVRELASLMVSMICMCIDSDFADIGITAEDLGFYWY